jgi:hypothetical protein
MKNVYIRAHEFNCLPGHIEVSAKGQGANLRVALQRAMGMLVRDARLKHKQVGEFKMNVVVTR